MHSLDQNPTPDIKQPFLICFFPSQRNKIYFRIMRSMLSINKLNGKLLQRHNFTLVLMQLRSIPALAEAQPGFVHSILCHQVLMLHKLPLPAGASAKGTAEQHSSTPGWEPLQAALNSCMQCTTFFFFLMYKTGKKQQMTL